MNTNATTSLVGTLAPEQVLILDVGTKDEALRALIEALGSAPQIMDKKALSRGIFEREELMSTGIGQGIGVPHVRLPSVTDLVMAAGVATGGISDYESLDGEPVRIILMIAARPDQHSSYLRLLAQISTRLRSENLRARILEATGPDGVCEVLFGEQEEV